MTLDGIVFGRDGDVVGPLGGATVELFIVEDGPSGETAHLLDRQTLSNAAGRYLLCFPRPGGSGLTPRGGQAFVVQARKDGFSSASESFKYGYSAWDYGGMSLNLELVRQ